MKRAIASLESISPYSQSRKHNDARQEREQHDDYEKRTWRSRLHVNADGNVFIPPMAFKNCLSEAAKYMSVQIPGKGKATYTKHFEAGVLVVDPLVLPIKAADVPGEWLSLNADGKRGSGKRVDRCMPCIATWSGNVEFLILDEIITKEAFIQHLEAAGNFIGIGRFRPRNNGYYGRFKIAKLTWDV